MKFAIAAAAAVLALAGCNSNPVVQTRTVTIYAPQACASPPSPYALGTSPSVLFQPLGDFQPQSSLESVPLSEVGAALSGFPSDTQEVTAMVSGTGATSAAWAAHSLLASMGNIDLLALPSGTPCTLTDPIGASAGAVLGAIDEGHVLIVGGTPSTDGGAVPATTLIDLTQGTVATLPLGLLIPRTEATVTAWSGGVVVAGGVGLQSTALGTLNTFEIYDTSFGDFTRPPGTLSQARARHGAAVLVSGETLLVGGVDGDGGILGSMEAIDPSTGTSRTAGLAPLAYPRADPIVMRLASGEILVAGGVDGNGVPVPELEWFPADGSQWMGGPENATLVASSNEAFIPLGAGGALAVIAPDANGADGGVDDGGTSVNVWGISAEHGLFPATSIGGSLTDVSLFAGDEGAPILWTGDRWLIWQPWVNAFASLTSAIGAPGPTGDPIASPEPGLGVWTDGTSVFALRSGTRGPYAATLPLVFTDTANMSFAKYVAPDQLISSGALTLDSTSGLTLQPNASVFITDATFASFTLTLDLAQPGEAPPTIVLRDDTGTETVLDGTACSLTPGSTLQTLQIVRDGSNTVSASVNGGVPAACTIAPAPGARVSIGLRGGADGSVVQSLAVMRM
ncbi:MAG: hypothetical protein ACLQVI_30775 [Polyangiaceae bacterium]